MEPTSSVYLFPYSDKSIAVLGDTKPIKDHLKSLGGRFNKSLKGPNDTTQPGWIFMVKSKPALEQLIAQKCSGGSSTDTHTDRTDLIDSADHTDIATEPVVSSADAVAKNITSNTSCHSSQTSAITIVPYSEKSVAVFGDTKPVKDNLRALGGRFNKYLKGPDGASQPGWVFMNKMRPELEQLLSMKCKSNGPNDTSQVTTAATKTSHDPDADPIRSTSSASIDASKSSSPITIVSYSEKSIAVFGDTKPIKDDLKSLGGRFNKSLKGPNNTTQPGWIFMAKSKPALEQLIAQKFPSTRGGSNDEGEVGKKRQRTHDDSGSDTE